MVAYELRGLSGGGTPRTSAFTIGAGAPGSGPGGQTSSPSGGDSEDAPEPSADLPMSQGQVAAALAAASTPSASARIAAAQQEARSRWPEFADAWAARTSEQLFYIKKCFEEEGKTECLWCIVES